MNLKVTRKNANYILVGDDLVLDIFRIGYIDFCSGQLTSKKLFYRSLQRAYIPKGYTQAQINQVILVVTKSAWFEDRSDTINLTYKGVEIYLGFSQAYEGKKQAIEASIWAQKAYTIAVISLIVGAIGCILTLVVK